MEYDPNYDMYYVEVDGGWDYYNPDGSYAGFEDYGGGWYVSNGYVNGYNGNGYEDDTGAGGGQDTTDPYTGAPGVEDWLSRGEHIGDEEISVAEIGVKAQSDPWYSKVFDVLKSIGKGALDVLGNIQISAGGGSGGAGGGPTVTIPGRGTYDVLTGKLLPETSLTSYLPYLLVGGLAYLLFVRK